MIELLIYNQLRASGVSHAGALGLMGNWQAESGLEPYRLQGDFSSGRTASHAYTADVMSGRISRTQFARDQKGYGLAQWTYFNFSTGQGRKQELYDFWKKSGKALDDVSMQVSFALHELRTEAQYAGLWRFLQTTDDIRAATDKVCRLYEQPYYCNVDARYNCAIILEKRIHAGGASAATVAEAEHKEAGTKTPAQEERYYPYRMLDKSMSGKDVAVLQAILDARGYSTETDGIIGEITDQAIRQFQRDHSLAVDGVCGPLTWKEVLRYDV